MKINKGGVGRFIEKLIGFKNTNALTDFSDGKLKTNKADTDCTTRNYTYLADFQ